MAVQSSEKPKGQLVPPPSPPAPVSHGTMVGGGEVVDHADPMAWAQAAVNIYSQKVAGALGMDVKPISIASGTAAHPSPSGTNYPGYYDPSTGAVHLDPAYILAHPADSGLILHELTHAYLGAKAGPSWLSEGIADWVREQVGGVPAARGESATAGYSGTARFIDFLERTHPGTALALAKAVSDGSYDGNWFKEHTGQTLQQLTNTYSPANQMEMYPDERDTFALLKRIGLAEDDVVHLRAYPVILFNQYAVSPESWRAAVLIYQSKMATVPDSEAAGYTYFDYVADVADAVRRGPDYLASLEQRLQRDHPESLWPQWQPTDQGNGDVTGWAPEMRESGPGRYEVQPGA